MKTLSRIGILLLALLCGAFTHGVPANQGRAQMNLGLGDTIPANLTNIFKAGAVDFFSGATPAALGADGFPNASFTGLITVTFSPGAWTGVTYTLSWPSTRTFSKMTFLTNTSDCVAVNATVTGCGGGNVTVATQAGLAGSVRFTLTAFSVQLDGTGTYSGSGEIFLGRTTDIAAYAAGERFTPEYIALLNGLHLGAIRPMGWVNTVGNNLSSVVKWAYQANPTSFSWVANQYFPDIWGGTVSGTDAYTIVAAPVTPATWTVNEIFQGTVTNAPTQITVSGADSNGGNVRLTVNSTATLTPGQSVWNALIGGTTEANGVHTILTVDDGTRFTINVPFVNVYTASGYVGTQTIAVTGKSGGAKFLATALGVPFFTNFESGASYQGPQSYFYDAILDRVIQTSGGITGSVPIEVQARLANRINANLWAVVPAWAEDDYVTQWATAALTNLNPTLTFEPEYSNEVWNFSFPQTQWATQRGLALGFPLTNNEAVYGWYALRVREIMGNLIPPVWAGRMAKLRRTLMFQGVGGVVSITSLYRLQSADLAPLGVSTGKGNALYSSYTGGANYTAKPNRTVDVIEVAGFAPYQAGTNFSDQGLNGGTVASAANATFLQNLATLAAANPNDPTALTLLDNDFRQGTIKTQTFSCPGGTTITLSSHGFIANGNADSGLVFTVTGGSLCANLLTTQSYCIINIATNTFQVSEYQSDGSCSSTPISVGSGTGTPSVGQANRTTLIGLIPQVYKQWENMVTGFDSDRPVGMAALRLEWYEGAVQPVTPAAATLTSIGVLIPAGSGTGAAANTALDNLLTAWKFSSYASPFYQSYYKQGLGLDSTVPSFGLLPHVKAPAHLVLPGPGVYSLLTDAKPTSIPYQLYYGVAAFSAQ